MKLKFIQPDMRVHCFKCGLDYSVLDKSKVCWRKETPRCRTCGCMLRFNTHSQINPKGGYKNGKKESRN